MGTLFVRTKGVGERGGGEKLGSDRSRFGFMKMTDGRMNGTDETIEVNSFSFLAH
jgi:hypothetical protein